MKFSQIDKGKRAERVVDFDLPNGASAKCALRPLTGQEESDAVAWAIAYAKKKSVDEPKAGHPIFDVGFWAASLATAAVDTDSPPDKREPFFSSADEVLEELGTESIAVLYERLEVWQEECSPSKSVKSISELIAMTKKFAEASDEGPFVRTSPATRWIWARFTAKLALTSPELKSLSTSPSEATGQTSKKSTRRTANGAAS